MKKSPMGEKVTPLVILIMKGETLFQEESGKTGGQPIPYERRATKSYGHL